MRIVDNAGKAWLAFAILMALHIGRLASQSAVAPSGSITSGSITSGSITTLERIEIETWWPTQASLPLEGFAGSAACLKCHDQGAASHLTSMQRASMHASDSGLSKDRRPETLPFETFTYSVRPAPGGVAYSVSKGQRKLSEELAWVMGAGDLGQTFLYQADGRWYQSQVSYYTRPSALDQTTGLHVDAAASLPAALGTLLSAEDARSCFACHTVHATSSAGFDPARAEPGIGCEACHGPSVDHVRRMSAANGPTKENDLQARPDTSSAFNPARLAPADSIDFCGACHRSFADATLSVGPGAGTAVVRFQPYRLEESKCWRSTKDARLTCVACHDPHLPLDRDAASYDRHCLACHTTAAGGPAVAHSGEICPKATSACVSCHMPKVAVASMHGEFTDHFIRIARAGEPLPR